MKRQPQFETPKDMEKEIHRFTWKEAAKLIVLWIIGIAGMIWVAYDGIKNNW